MAKFLKSIFHTTDRRKTTHYENEDEEEKSESPQMGSRRQLSISRSGRMRQANKKRHSLTLELYGDNIQIEPVEDPTFVEYHVHSSSHTAPAELGAETRFEDTSDIEDTEAVEESTNIANTFDDNLETKLRKLALSEKSPEEEIDSAFEIIDKS